MLSASSSVGDLERRGGRWVLVAPRQCAQGHRLGGSQVLVGTTACLCGVRHTTWACQQCGDVTYGPARGRSCVPTAGVEGR